MVKRKFGPRDHRVCGVCMGEIVPPQMPNGAQVMVFAEFPGVNEMQQKIPFAPSPQERRRSTGDILRSELRRVGIVPERVVLSNLWLHPMPKTKADQDTEIEWHVARLLETMIGAKAVMMFGDECTRRFLDSPVGVLSSLEVKIDVFPESVETVTVGPNPAGVFHGPIGEIRLAIEKFARRAEEWL